MALRFVRRRVPLAVLLCVMLLLGTSELGASSSGVCESETTRATVDPLVSLRTRFMPDLPERGIWIEPGESLCVLSAPCDDSTEVCQTRLSLAKRTDAAALKIELEHQEGELYLTATSLGTSAFYLFANGILLPPVCGGTEERYPLAWMKVGADTDAGVLLMVFRQEGAHAECKKLAGFPPENLSGESQGVTSSTEMQIALGLPLFSFQGVQSKPVSDLLVPLGYSPLTRSVALWGGTLDFTIGPLYLGLSGLFDGERLRSKTGDLAKVQLYLLEAYLGLAFFERQHMAFTWFGGGGVSGLSLEFLGSSAALPALARGQKEITARRGNLITGLRFEHHLLHWRGASMALRTEAGVRVGVGRGVWGYWDKNDDWQKLAAGQTHGVGGPYALVGVVGALRGPLYQ